MQAVRGTAGTSRSDVKEEAQAAINREGERTDRSTGADDRRSEKAVMGLERGVGSGGRMTEATGTGGPRCVRQTSRMIGRFA